MWKLTIILSILLFASMATFVDSAGVDARTMNKKIEQLIEQVWRTQASANMHIVGNYARVKFDHFWTTSQNKTNDGVPELQFTDSGVGFEITNASEINDQSCRDYVQTFPESERTVCGLVWDGIIQLHEYKIKKTATETETYLTRSKITYDIHDAPSNNETFSAKIESLNKLVHVTTELIENAMNAALKKIRNYVEEVSYCLISRRDYDLGVVRGWWEACSYYTQA